MLWVDMNDNVAVKTLTVQADVPARKLKRFAVQTSLNGKAFTTVGTWPEPAPTWNGSLQTKVMRFVLPEGFEIAKLAEQRAMINEALEIGGDPAAPPPVVLPGTLTANLGAQIMGLAAKLGVEPDLKSPESWYVLHLRGAFYLPKRAERAFRANVSGEARHVLAVDGRVADPDKRTGAVALSGSFGKGVHVLDFYLWAQRGSQVSYAIESDIKEVPYFGTCPAEMFDVVKNPQIPVAVQFTPASVVAQPDNNGFDITFATNTQARLIRLALLDFEGDAPAIKRLNLTAADGRTVLPTKQDLLALRKNDVLECVPGDKIKIIFENPAPLTKERRIQEATLAATFCNASLSASFMEFRDSGHGERVPFYIGMRRFRLGDPINVFISDADCDVSDKADTVKFTARATSGAIVELEALEVESASGGGRGGVHSGVFMGKILPVDGQPQRTNELNLATADDVQITYRDMENTDFGVPWDRTVVVEQAGTDDPELRMFDVVSSLLPPNLRAEEPPSNTAQKADAEGGGHWQWTDLPGEFVPGRRVIGTTCRDSIDDTSSATGLVVCPVTVEITWPAMALSSLSTLRLHAQTGSSRRKAEVTDDTAFDPAMPGTITLEAGTGIADKERALPPGYKSSVFLRSEARQAVDVGSPLDQGLFAFSIPLQLGETSTAPASTPESRLKDPSATSTLTVRPDDEVFIGFEFKSLVVSSNAETGVVGTDTNTHWIVRRVKLPADTQAFDVMDKQYRAPVHGIYMGEKVYLRVVDLPACTKTGEKNTCTVSVQAGDAPPISVTLTETRPYSSVFKGLLQVNAAEDVAASNAPPGVLAAKYGDTVTLTYSGGASNQTIERSFRVATGSDGNVQSFTKRFKDPNIAVQTQFSVAEAYFELAKNHRQLKQEELSRREIAQGSKLLQEAIRDFPQNDARAQADYLLAELSLELATDTKDEAEKKKISGDALQRFSDICSSYPDSPYAPKAQFKKAVSLEKMGLIDEACQEYVKLAYKYPDHELVAETIARLGKYFLDKGKKMESEMASITEAVKKEKMRLQTVEMYKTAAQVLARLAKRFPDHSLAAKTSVLSGQCWMRAEDYDRAVAVFRAVVDSKRAAPDLAAEAMYWCGDAYMKGAKKSPGRVVDAYRIWKKLTWDYPEGQWAKYARGRLTEPAVAAAEKADKDGG
jgi:TolA-binding protein